MTENISRYNLIKTSSGYTSDAVVFYIWNKVVLQQTSAQNSGRGQLPGRFEGDPE